MTFEQIFARLDAEGQKIVQVLAIFGQPVTPRAVSQVLRPFLPNLDSIRAEARLEQLLNEYPSLVGRERGHYFLNDADCQAALATLETGEPSDRYERGEPLYTRYTLLDRAAEYFKTRRKPRMAWRSLEDLAPQLAEFDLRVQGEDYETAATLLNEISFNYLLRWGHHRLVVELRERLVDKLDDPKLAQNNLGELGSAYAYLGEMEKAIDCQERALLIARRNRDRVNEGVWLTNLGNRYVNLGQTPRAVPYYEQALVIARDQRDRRAEALNIASLGTCYAYLGQMEKALECYDQGRSIARELNDLSMEGFCLSNLGNIYASLGQATRAIAAHDQAIEIARQMGSRVEEARRLGSLADALIIGEHYAEAIENLILGLQLDEETGSARGKSYKGVSLARAYLFTGDLEQARAAAEMARLYDTPQNNHNALTVLGVIATRQGDSAAAQEAFTEAIAQARQALEHNANNQDALAAQGLAFSGLTLLGVGPRSANTEAAVTAYRLAYQANSSAGLVALALRLFDALAVADLDGRLSAIRPAITGG
jgi:tetratricopeptide (TPR) repeat protein